MKEKFLSREQFERQSFVEWMRTGRYYTYESYLRYRFPPKTIEKKFFMGISPEDFVPEKGKTYVQWSEGGCDECSDLGGQIFEAGQEPGEIHPNCQCYTTLLDAKGFPTKEKIKLKPWKPKEKEVTSDIITSPYGKRKHPLTGIIKMHKGIDFAKVPKGTPIVAVKGGIVKESKLSPSFGNKIIIEHRDGTRTIYAHMEDLSSFKVGDVVNENDIIGKVGNTGKSAGIHLHYQREEYVKGTDGRYNWESFQPETQEINFLVDYFEKYR